MTKQPSTRLVNYSTSASVGLNSFTRLVWNDIVTNCLPRKLSPRILNTSASSKMRSRAHRSASSSLKISRHRAGFLLLVKTVLKLPSLLYLRSTKSKNRRVFSRSNSQWPISSIIRQEGRTKEFRQRLGKCYACRDWVRYRYTGVLYASVYFLWKRYHWEPQRSDPPIPAKGKENRQLSALRQSYLPQVHWW